ncbi:hypothetical protein DYB36_005583 [Aphanomyces astaci]|uniref:Uncharacterized protein n=1 Tax=Aphanomyces astaci TaxID=112090 RepID=A0A397AQD3_APHAT|nr:hypothetical protein DYB36_005583 [Aphanomyces astaci]
MWEYGLSNYPFVPVEVGLNRRISYTLPSRIPQHCVRLLNASAAREHWECTGLPELLVRNTASYPFHLPNTRLKWQGNVRSADKMFLPKIRASRDASQFLKRFKDSGIPHDVLAELLLEENRLQESNRALRSDRQGNALRATTWNDHQLLFYPTGELLHQLQVKRRRGATWHSACDQPISLVNPIQQIDLLGTIDAGTAPRAVVRGAASCHVITFHDDFSRHTVDAITFPSMLHHIAPSPHVSVHWYHGHASHDPSMLSLRRSGSSAAASQLAAADAAFDIHLPDPTPSIHQIGVSALRTADGVCDLFQLTSLGDVPSAFHLVLLSLCITNPWTCSLPCGRTLASRRVDIMPVPAQAFLPEHDAASLPPFRLLPVRKLHRVLDQSNSSVLPLLPPDDPLEDLPHRLAAVVTPSTTLLGLMHTYRHVRPTYGQLGEAVRALAHVTLRFATPHSRSQYHTLRRVSTADPSLMMASCGCHSPLTTYLSTSSSPPPPLPCEHAQCPLPHLWVIHHTITTPPDQRHSKPSQHSIAPLTNQPLQYDPAAIATSSHAQIIVDLEAVYGCSTDALPQSPRRVQHQQKHMTTLSW